MLRHRRVCSATRHQHELTALVRAHRAAARAYPGIGTAIVRYVWEVTERHETWRRGFGFVGLYGYSGSPYGYLVNPYGIAPIAYGLPFGLYGYSSALPVCCQALRLTAPLLRPCYLSALYLRRHNGASANYTIGSGRGFTLNHPPADSPHLVAQNR